MRRSVIDALHFLPACGVLCLMSWCGLAGAADPVALRAESFMVAPSSQPLAFVQIKNIQDKPYEGVVTLTGPDVWRIVPERRDVVLQPGETRRVQFNVEKGLSTAANSYAMEVTATGSGATVVRRQDVVCASAPYFSPTIDGDPSDWGDAIPITFRSGGKQTVVSTFWNRRQFSMLVAVGEDRLVRHPPAGDDGTCDAVQVAMSPQETTTGTSAEEEATRFEFLFVATGKGSEGKCFQLASPGMKLGEGQRLRDLAPLELDGATVAVSRRGDTTYYECSIPFKPMRSQIRPSEGREFFLSVLVHDPDGTGVRDWGEAAGLWPWQRNRLAWGRWPGAKWGDQPPFDNKLCWGLCTSKY